MKRVATNNAPTAGDPAGWGDFATARMTALSAPVPVKAPEASLHEVVERAKRLRRLAVSKVRRPPAQQRINRRDCVAERVFRARPRQPSHFLAHARLRPLRRPHRQIPVSPPMPVAHVPQREAQKSQTAVF
jgi:hypothetical protein